MEDGTDEKGYGRNYMNITYKSDGFAKYYSTNRHHWEEFYESERYIMGHFMDGMNAPFSVLDVGCGCGGLGKALSERYQISMYKGIDINLPNIEAGKKILSLNCPFELSCEDVAKMKADDGYDFVISFSCIDYNLEVKEMLDACWAQVKSGGRLILSVRLTNERGINDIKQSYQPVDIESELSSEADEVANYVVFNCNEFFQTIKTLDNLAGATGYGYWGAPSKTAHTPYSRLCFSVFGLEKGNADIPYVNLRLPLDLFDKA